MRAVRIHFIVDCTAMWRGGADGCVYSFYVRFGSSDRSYGMHGRERGRGRDGDLLRKLQFLRYFGTYFGIYNIVLISHAT